MIDNNVNGLKIRQLRQLKGFSGEELAHRTGLSKGYIYKIENGEGNPSLYVLARISEVLNIDINELFSDGSDGLTGVLNSYKKDIANERRTIRHVKPINKALVETAATTIRERKPSLNFVRTVNVPDDKEEQIMSFIRKMMTEKSESMYKSLNYIAGNGPIRMSLNNDAMTVTADLCIKDAILMLYSIFLSDSESNESNNNNQSTK